MRNTQLFLEVRCSNQSQRRSLSTIVNLIFDYWNIPSLSTIMWVVIPRLILHVARTQHEVKNIKLQYIHNLLHLNLYQYVYADLRILVKFSG